MPKTITSIDEYNDFEFKAGQQFQVVNAKYLIKNINGVLFVVDHENYGSEINQDGQVDHLKHAIECNQIIQHLVSEK